MSRGSGQASVATEAKRSETVIYGDMAVNHQLYDLIFLRFTINPDPSNLWYIVRDQSYFDSGQH